MTNLGPLSPSVPDALHAAAEPLSRAAGRVRLLVDGQEPASSRRRRSGLRPPPTRCRYCSGLQVEVGGAVSNRVSADGPSLYDASPAEIRAGSETVVTLRSLNLSPASNLRLAGARVAGTFTDGPLRTFRFVPLQTPVHHRFRHAGNR